MQKDSLVLNTQGDLRKVIYAYFQRVVDHMQRNHKM